MYNIAVYVRKYVHKSICIFICYSINYKVFIFSDWKAYHEEFKNQKRSFPLDANASLAASDFIQSQCLSVYFNQMRRHS